MNDEQKKIYIAWLNDAHAMEEGLERVLEAQIKETEGKPEMQSQLKTHLEETKEHARKVRACIERNGGSVSAAKDFMSKVGATVNSLGMSMVSDAMVKNVHSSYAAEHFEIATYTTLRAAAEALGDTEGVSMCDEILKDEERMADWLLMQLPEVVETHVKSL